MKKIIFLVALSLALPCFPLQAAGTLTITNTGAPQVYFYPSEFDRLAMDFTVARTDGTADTLKAITLVNGGTARNFYEISKVFVWADAGPAGFQGMEVDENLGEAVRTEIGGYWYLSNLSKAVPASGLRLFVSIETNSRAAITAHKTVQMRIPAAIDNETIGQFDIGDTGLFLGSAMGPAEALINPSIQTILVSSTDVSAPKTVILDPDDGATISTTTYKISGVSRDQGGSTPASVKISISPVGGADNWVEVASVGANYSTWEYNWTAIANGTYSIKVYGTDWIGNNETPGEGIRVTVDQTALISPSASLSTVVAAPTALLADGMTKATVTVTVKNSAGNPLSGKTVSLTSSRTADKITAVKDTTGVDGVATFEISSSEAGSSVLTAVASSISLNQKPTIIFSTAALQAGDLIRGSGRAVYYFGANGKKYLFPTTSIYSSWFSNFSAIKTVSDADLSSKPLAGNVTVRPGTLVQLVTMDSPWRITDSKVYAVSRGGVLRWLKTSELARGIFGTDWEKKITALPEVFATNYVFGNDISSASDYNLASEQAVATIGQDKNLE